MKDSTEISDVKGLNTHIKKLASYLPNLYATFFGFTWDVETLAQLLTYELYRLRIRTEAFHVKMVQKNIMEQEHGTVGGSIW